MKRVYTLYRVSTKKQVNTSEEHGNDIPMQRGVLEYIARNVLNNTLLYEAVFNGETIKESIWIK